MDAKEEVSWQKKVGVPLTPEPLPLFKDQEEKKCLSRENVAIECEQFGKLFRGTGTGALILFLSCFRVW